MTIKVIQRNIPAERENKHDRFRVKYNDTIGFSALQVSIKRLATGEMQDFYFDAKKLPSKDSIYFTTSIVKNKLLVTWKDATPAKSSELPGNFSTSQFYLKSEAISDSKVKEAFPPIADKNSKVLILGTMPGERSLKEMQYYADGRNQFWKIMFALLKQPFSLDYSVRKQLLLNNQIALWDVLKFSEREGSSDNNIKNESPNDFNSFFVEHPLISKVYFTSSACAIFYDKYIGRTSALSYAQLPSPSSASASKTLAQKIEMWSQILSVLENE